MPTDKPVTEPEFPGQLLEWSGHGSGGVRRLFDTSSGRPAGTVVRTQLLERLDSWVFDLSAAKTGTPRCVFLIGGPGNGKTEAVEYALTAVDAQLGARGALLQTAKDVFNPPDSVAVPRLTILDTYADNREFRQLAVVQDASVPDATRPGLSPAALLVDDIERIVLPSAGPLYLACVNRGILDDAQITASEEQRYDALRLLQAIVSAVGVDPNAPDCWPLDGAPTVAVWPMDVESLVSEGANLASPAGQVLHKATDATSWPASGTCPAGELCPFCYSRSALSETGQSFLKILRWYELATGKRWTFRDLFSLFAFLLAGARTQSDEHGLSPCQWAAHLATMASNPNSKPEGLRVQAPFLLVSAQYQHALFGTWPKHLARQLRIDLKDLKLIDNSDLRGLASFLGGQGAQAIPGALAPQLIDAAEALDPALADPDVSVDLSSRTSVPFREIDLRFSHSTGEGLKFLRRYHALSPIEVTLLQRLARADDLLAEPEIRRRRPATATRVQALIRDFSCRLSRRSLGVRHGVTKNAAVLVGFERVSAGDVALLHEASKQVESLLNSDDRFVVSLNTTFGEPLPPENRRATLNTSKQKVRPREARQGGRPSTPIRYLSVGSTHASPGQTIPLTYDLYKSVKELRSGMLPASLPRTVVALLDTTRARMAGRIVRDEDLLDGAEIRIGSSDEVIARELQRFVVRREDRS